MNWAKHKISVENEVGQEGEQEQEREREIDRDERRIRLVENRLFWILILWTHIGGAPASCTHCTGNLFATVNSLSIWLNSLNFFPSRIHLHLVSGCLYDCLSVGMLATCPPFGFVYRNNFSHLIVSVCVWVCHSDMNYMITLHGTSQFARFLPLPLCDCEI